MTWADLVSQGMPLLGVLVGGLITYFVTTAQNRHQARMETKRRFLDRMEQLHDLLGNASNGASLIKMAMIYFLTNRTDGLRNLRKKTPVNLGKLNMLVDYYAPQLRADADDIQNGLDLLGNLTAELVRKHTDDERIEIFKQAVEADKRVKLAVTSAKTKLKEIVGPHTRLQC